MSAMNVRAWNATLTDVCWRVKVVFSIWNRNPSQNVSNSCLLIFLPLPNLKIAQLEHSPSKLLLVLGRPESGHIWIFGPQEENLKSSENWSSSEFVGLNVVPIFFLNIGTEETQGFFGRDWNGRWIGLDILRKRLDSDFWKDFSWNTVWNTASTQFTACELKNSSNKTMTKWEGPSRAKFSRPKRNRMSNVCCHYHI